ncbi:hypothetical protein VTJ49DRAFT_4541 [Mycothermus thermophilus]|uniref:Glycosyl hydrolase n=1 Tax=Humicola insolens TaxID=85995 RepID=A0ABR3V5G7_HUMIN
MRVLWVAVVATAATVCSASPWTGCPSTPTWPPGVDNNVTSPDQDWDVLNLMFNALSTMQDTYFERWVGTWPEGNDWTRAVINTHVVAALRTITDELNRKRPGAGDGECSITDKHHLIAGYFADVIAYYFGEDAFAIRRQAYDDMLWVVLSWLESIQFVKEHGNLLSPSRLGSPSGITAWYGDRWTPAFAHRSRIFWELAAGGWDTKLCGGGMIWSPHVLPYKNAVTNELFISASIAMYLHFPGDANNSPFGDGSGSDDASNAKFYWQPRDPVFGKAAQNAHTWLTASNMTNDQGLYTDGFHISGLDSGNTRCDERNEMVYTYNQGVILSGLLGLYQATGHERYLDEGHSLIENVIHATGFDLARCRPFDMVNDDDAAITTKEKSSPLRRSTHKLPPWRGLGRLGILEDACDASGTCSQDGQTFKSIWMHHFAKFCAPTSLLKLKDTYSKSAHDVRARHRARCQRYIPWLRRNAHAALGTRDEKGLFGMWWTVGLFAEGVTVEEVEEVEKGDRYSGRWPKGAMDYRNLGVPGGRGWMPEDEFPSTEQDVSSSSASGTETDSELESQKAEKSSGGRRAGQKPLASRDLDARDVSGATRDEEQGTAGTASWDPNLRGRGRTLETQAGGLAVLRALWVVSGNE